MGGSGRSGLCSPSKAPLGDPRALCWPCRDLCPLLQPELWVMLLCPMNEEGLKIIYLNYYCINFKTNNLFKLLINK